jgi:hypothetical protein
MGIEILARNKEGPRLERSGEPSEGALKAQEESTSVEGRLTREEMLCRSGHPARKKTSAPRSGGRATIRGWTPVSEEPDVDTLLTVASKFARTLHRKPHFQKASCRRSRRASSLGALQGPASI